MNQSEFADAFAALTGNRPFPWLWALYQRFTACDIPSLCSVPTGLGKTSVIHVWLLALAYAAADVPRRLVYVVNRRTVVDQSTDEARKLRDRIDHVPDLRARLQRLCVNPEPDDLPFAISTLRGQFADNREWSADPTRPAVIVGTVDMIGSRLLFGGYGVGFKARPLHAGFLGQDVLLVHDEAHLELPFQTLIEEIRQEQERYRELFRFRVMALSATARGEDQPFTLTDEEQNPPEQIPDPPRNPTEVAWRRLRARKTITLHELDDEKKLADAVAALALKHKDSGQTILVFVRKVDDVERIVKSKRLPKGTWQQLTGTLRGLERDQLAKRDPIFARFLPPSNCGADVTPREGTVYLICTSAGEVGVNISADHLVCDLTPFDSMAQRFGRVNRFGDRDDTRIDIVYPREFDEDDDALKNTLKLLEALNGDGSPLALGKLNADARQAAFAPTPTILPVSDILFDAWALTTIRGKLPGRPPVEPYLHGLTNDPPETHVAWREEVWHLRPRFRSNQDRQQREAQERKRLAGLAAELLDDYPLKPHELLRDRSDPRVFKHLAAMAERHPDFPAWVLDDDGTVEVLTLGQLAERDEKARLHYRTVLLPPDAGGLALDDGESRGLLDGGAEYEPTHRRCYDVADEWRDHNDQQRRLRVWDDDPVPDDMRLIRTIDTRPDADESEDNESATPRFWHWYELAQEGDSDGSRFNTKAVRWQVHTEDVVRNLTSILAGLTLPEDLKRALILAARFHDLGKKRRLWQRSIGHELPRDPRPDHWLAKSGRGMRPLDITDYRHEFGSLLDAQAEPAFQAIGDEHLRDLVLHLIAAHHGRSRPHFPPAEAFDPDHTEEDAARVAAAVPQRFARLQRRYGRWGLAYLESLLRAADYAASANPSAFVEE